MGYAYCKSLKSYNIQHLMDKIIDLLTIQNLLQYIHKEWQISVVHIVYYSNNTH